MGRDRPIPPRPAAAHGWRRADGSCRAARPSASCPRAPRRRGPATRRAARSARRQLAHLGSAAGLRAAHAPGDRDARAVVAAQLVADADHEHARQLTHARPSARGSGSSTRCTGRGCGSPARSAASAASSGRSTMRSTTARRSSSIARWFCEVGGTMRRVEDRAVLVDLVAVVEHAAGRLGRAVPDRPARLHVDRRRVGRLVARR